MMLAQATDLVESPPDSLWSILSSGGVPGLLILSVLVMLSVGATYLVIDQALSLRRRDFVPDNLSTSIRQMLQNSRFTEAESALKTQPSVLAGLIGIGLARRDEGWPEIEKAVENALVDHSAALHRRIDYLAMIANLSPMVGLLGTVTGMIFAFRQVAATSGAAGAGDLAEGIYQALVTTVGGLLVAIPALAASGVLRSRVDELMSDVTRHADTALRPLKRRATGVSVSPSGPMKGRVPMVPPAQLPGAAPATPSTGGPPPTKDNKTRGT